MCSELTQIILLNLFHKITGVIDGIKQIFEDRGNRLNGGNSDNGGLANVNYNLASNHWSNRAFRFLEMPKCSKGRFNAPFCYLFLNVILFLC